MAAHRDTHEDDDSAGIPLGPDVPAPPGRDAGGAGTRDVDDPPNSDAPNSDAARAARDRGFRPYSGGTGDRDDAGRQVPGSGEVPPAEPDELEPPD